MAKKNTLEIADNIYDQYKNDYKKLLTEMKKLIKQGNETANKELIGAAYYYLALANKDYEDKDGTFTNSLKAVSILEKTKNYSLLAKSYICLGYAYGTDENTQLELSCYDKALSIIKRHRIYGDIRITALNNISACYHAAGNCEISIRILNECISYLKKDSPDNYSDLLMYSINLGNCYDDNGETEKTLEVLESAEEYANNVSFKPLVCDYYVKHAIISFKLGNESKGISSCDKAFEYLNYDYFPLPLYDDLRQLSHVLVERNDKERAGKIIEPMNVYAEKNKGTFEQIIAYRTFAEYYRVFGDYERSLECYQRLEELYDKHTTELRLIKTGIYNRMKKVDAEIRLLNKKIEKSEELANREPLTMLLNRSALLKVGSDFINTAVKRKLKIGAIFIDIDHFKEFNDTYGHSRGDEIIKEVARACQKEESEEIRFSRYGGDEFFGITLGLQDSDVAAIAARICDRMRKAKIENVKNPYGIVTLSAGVVNVKITEKTDTIIEIANYADKAVYYAKRAGKNAVYFLDYGHTDKDGKDDPFIRIDV